MQKLDDLIVFIRVVERGSFIAAARQLGMPAATVSRKIQELEHRLGLELLRRTTRRVFVTDAGRAVYDRAARGLALIDEAELIAKRHHGTPAGVLRIVAPFSVGILTLNPLLPAFQERYPEVQIHLTLNNDALDLIEHGFDVGVRIGALKDSGYVVRRLYHGQRRIVASPLYLDRAASRIETIADLPQHVFLYANNDFATTATHTFVNGRERQTVVLVARLASNEGSVILDHLLRGVGFSILSDAICQDALETGALQVILPDWHLEEDLELSIIFSRHATTDPKIRLFIDFLAKTAQPPRSHFEPPRAG